MPVRKKKLPSGKVQVSHGGKVSAKGTTQKKADAQERLLNAVEHGWKPTGKPAKKKRHHSASGGSFIDQRSNL
uniref:Uncharacterized protein n=1 Tax=viral metagenome TaxID=1070528 RepID=A0A6M3JCN2_9ZZZZ